ncbi:MAG TPA: nitrilase-related carbon-nitrogen hydrolase, partial [candidate division Zixibacteria bacterium]|nr:nitrilase-related carbon-nitrogen hydrolase [candidate division Zixibacteria bacterium]
MTQQLRTFTVAAVQTSPVFLNKKQSTEKVCDLIAEAGANGAKLVVFPEAIIPAYPDWVWVLPIGPKKALYNQLYTELLANAVSIPDETTAALCKAAKAAGVTVAVGVNERNTEASGASLYNTLL